ncbi:MAG: hypothetical protein ACP6IY_10525 [Promethearchaeia archaeon]
MGSEIVFHAGIKREPLYIYYIDKNGNIVKIKEGGKPQIVLELNIEKEPGYVYFLDKNGDVARFKVKKL